MITHFPKPEIPNRILPGIVAFQFTPVADVSSFPDTLVQNLEQAIVFNGAKDWLVGYATFQSLKLDVQPVRENGVLMYRHTLPGRMPGSDSQIDDLMAGMLRANRFLVNAKDNRGRWRMIGNKNVGARFDAEYSTGELGGSRTPGWSFTFSWTHHLPAPFYLAAASALNPNSLGGTDVTISRVLPQAPQILNSVANQVDWDVVANVYGKLTLTENTTLQYPDNLHPDDNLELMVVSDGVSTLDFAAGYEKVSGETPGLDGSEANGDRFYLVFKANEDGTKTVVRKAGKLDAV